MRLLTSCKRYNSRDVYLERQGKRADVADIVEVLIRFGMESKAPCMLTLVDSSRFCDSS
jgi:hypothetical protein